MLGTNETSGNFLVHTQLILTYHYSLKRCSLSQCNSNTSTQLVITSEGSLWPMGRLNSLLRLGVIASSSYDSCNPNERRLYEGPNTAC